MGFDGYVLSFDSDRILVDLGIGRYRGCQRCIRLVGYRGEFDDLTPSEQSLNAIRPEFRRMWQQVNNSLEQFLIYGGNDD